MSIGIQTYQKKFNQIYTEEVKLIQETKNITSSGSTEKCFESLDTMSEQLEQLVSSFKAAAAQEKENIKKDSERFQSEAASCGFSAAIRSELERNGRIGAYLTVISGYEDMQMIPAYCHYKFPVPMFFCDVLHEALQKNGLSIEDDIILCTTGDSHYLNIGDAAEFEEITPESPFYQMLSTLHPYAEEYLKAGMPDVHAELDDFLMLKEISKTPIAKTFSTGQKRFCIMRISPLTKTFSSDEMDKFNKKIISFKAKHPFHITTIEFQNISPSRIKKLEDMALFLYGMQNLNTSSLPEPASSSHETDCAYCFGIQLTMHNDKLNFYSHHGFVSNLPIPLKTYMQDSMGTVFKDGLITIKFSDYNGDPKEKQCLFLFLNEHLLQGKAVQYMQQIFQTIYPDSDIVFENNHTTYIRTINGVQNHIDIQFAIYPSAVSFIGDSIYSFKNGRHKLTAYEKEFMDCVYENPVYSGGFADAVCNAIKEIYTANFAVENNLFLKP